MKNGSVERLFMFKLAVLLLAALVLLITRQSPVRDLSQTVAPTMMD
jgi:hypothetical protein